MLQLRILDFFDSTITFRDESVSTKHRATVSDLVGYVSSWSAFQNCRNQEGEEKAADILHNLEQELVQLYTLYLSSKMCIPAVLRIFPLFFLSSE
jgi:hypothetical protein